jgi:hypothetical protein
MMGEIHFHLGEYGGNLDGSLEGLMGWWQGAEIVIVLVGSITV